MKNYKPLPQEQKPTPENKNHLIIIALICGIIIGACLLNISFKEGFITGYYTDEVCEDMVVNASIIGAYQMINHTQTTGEIYLFNNTAIIESDVCEYCGYLQQLNNEGGK